MTSKGRFTNPFSAVMTGVMDVFRTDQYKNLWSDIPSLNGKVCLVTGANSGLGLGIAILLAQKGGHVIMACRKHYEEALQRVKSESRSEAVEMRIVDLTDKTSIDNFVDTLKADGIRLDVSIHNAGVTTPKGVQLTNGQDEMFMVNYLSKFILINALLDKGIIPISAPPSDKAAGLSRIILVSSDSHQGASAIDWSQFGVFEAYAGPNRAVSLYSYNKLILNTFAVELARRLMSAGRPQVSVLTMCPGPVNTNIVRHAPWALRMVLKGVFFLFFKSPLEAAKPVVYLAASPAWEGETQSYLHMWNHKKMDPKCYDNDAGAKLWTLSETLSRSVEMAVKR
jgi:NAD(P)-dependent dehydrogenase (short-subunit alcohol dehydrogenase family)